MRNQTLITIALGALAAAMIAAAQGPAVGPLDQPARKPLPTTAPAIRGGTLGHSTGMMRPTTMSSLRAARAARKPATMPAQPVVLTKFKPKGEKPTQAVAMETCTQADCHSNVKAYEAVHGPVNVNSCDACHKLADEKEHKYELVRNKSDMCAFCHQLEIQNMPVVHKPLESGECLACHNPHGGRNDKFLRADTMQGLCRQCHEDPVGDRKVVHGPVEAGACEGCHSAHAAKLPKLLLAEGRELCFTCHSEMQEQMASAKFVHKAAEKDCLECHDAHASDLAMMVRKPPQELCTSCHEHDKIRNDIAMAKFKHNVVTKDAACLNCHTAHGGDLAKLVKEEPIKICMTCHDKPIDTGKGGRQIPAVVEVMDHDAFKHGPIRDGNCSGCHSIHGADLTRLLAKPYSQQFYQAFSLDKYDLCFSCHDKQLVLLPNTEGLTGFRNGTQNLHYVHVNKSDRGRSCRACHSIHASKQPMQLRSTVPYGKWQMPLTFRKTDNGGTCSPGCHKPYDYDRVNPVAYRSAKPTLPPLPPGKQVRPVMAPGGTPSASATGTPGLGKAGTAKP